MRLIAVKNFLDKILRRSLSTLFSEWVLCFIKTTILKQGNNLL